MTVNLVSQPAGGGDRLTPNADRALSEPATTEAVIQRIIKNVKKLRANLQEFASLEKCSYSSLVTEVAPWIMEQLA